MTLPTFRRADDADAAVMAELARRAYQRYVSRIGREPPPMVADYAAVVREDEAWVAEVNDRIVGLLAVHAHVDHLLLANVAVDPDEQGRGIGTALLDLAEDRARQLGLPEIRLYTNAAMTENLAYYPRHGYRETHRSTTDGLHRVFFTKGVTSRGR